MNEEDKGVTTKNYILIPLMQNASNFQIGCLNAEIHNERMIYVGNDVVTEGNTLLSDDNIEMLVVPHINQGFMQFMQSKYGNLSRQKINMTIVRSDGEEFIFLGFKFVRQMKSVLLCTMIYILWSDGEEQSVTAFKFISQMKYVLLCNMIQVLCYVFLTFTLCDYCNGLLICQAYDQGGD